MLEKVSMDSIISGLDSVCAPIVQPEWQLSKDKFMSRSMELRGLCGIVDKIDFKFSFLTMLKIAPKIYHPKTHHLKIFILLIQHVSA